MPDGFGHAVVCSEEDRLAAVVPQSKSAALLLVAKHAVYIGPQILLHGRLHMGAPIGKGDCEFATSVGLRIESVISYCLAKGPPGIPFRGEGEAGERSPVGARWVLDPIDGAVNFAKDSRLCTISLGLVLGGQPVSGIVKFLGECFIASQEPGAFLNRTMIAVSEVESLREAGVRQADFSAGAGAEQENRVQLAVLARLARECLGVCMFDLARFDLAWLAAGRPNATVTFSNLLWYVTAALLVVREAGRLVYDYDGPRHDQRSCCTIASVPSLAEPVCRIVGGAM